MSTDTLIREILYRLRDRDYIWFRFSWSKLGAAAPRWVVWLEGLNGTTLSFSGPCLESALHELLSCLPEAS